VKTISRILEVRADFSGGIFLLDYSPLRIFLQHRKAFEKGRFDSIWDRRVHIDRAGLHAARERDCVITVYICRRNSWILSFSFSFYAT